MSIASEIQRLQRAKADIKQSLEEKGITVGDARINDYGQIITDAIIGTTTGGRLPKGIAEMKTGSFTVAEDTNETQYIAFNMQEAPTNFIVYADNDEQTANTFLCLFYGDLFKSFTGYDKQYLVHHTTIATNYSGGQRNFTQGGVRSIDKNGVSFRGYTASYYFRSSIKYNWIAWREGELDYDYNDYEQGYEDGKNSVNNPLEYATNYTGLYKDSIFPDGYELNVNLPCCLTVQYFINNAQGIKKLILSGNTQGNALTFTYFANKCSTIEEIDLSNFNTKVADFNNPFNNATNLKTVKGEFDLTNCEMISTNPFANCTSLVDISFKANSISLSLNMSQCVSLNNASIQSIIDGLADLTGGTTQTLTVHQNVRNKLTDDQLTTISNKNWAISPAEATN